MAQSPRLQPATAGRSSLSRRDRGRAVAAVVLVAVAVAFALSNTGRVKVHYIVGTAHPQLIWVIVGCLLVGAVLGWLGARRRRR